MDDDKLDELDEMAARAIERIEARNRAIREFQEELDLMKAANETPRTRGWFTDVGASAVRGVVRAVAATHEGLGKLVDRPARWLGEHLGDLTYSEHGLEFSWPSEVRAMHEKTRFKALITEQEPVNPVDQALTTLSDAIGAPETKTGSVTQGISQFITGLIPVNRAAKGLNVLQGGSRAVTFFRGLLTGGIASGVAFDNTEANLANLVQEFPSLANPVTEFLATDGDDSEIEGRLKNAITDMGGGAIFESFIVGLRSLKNLRRAKAGAMPDAADTRRVLDVDSVKLADEPAPHVAPEGTPSVSPAVREADSTAKALDEKTPTYGAVADEEAEAALRARLGITDEKLAELRGRIQRGEVQPEEVSKLVGLNGERMDWSNVRNVNDAVGLMNAVSRTFDEAAASPAGYARVSIESIAKHASEIGGSVKDSLAMWERMRGAPAMVLAQKATLEASRDRLVKLAEKISSGDHTPADLLEFVAHDRRHALLQITARGTRAEIGRSLRVLQEGVKVNEDALRLAGARRMREARQAQDAAAQGVPVVPPQSAGRLTLTEANDALREVGLDVEKVQRLAQQVKQAPDAHAAARTSLWFRTQERITGLYINNLLSGLPTLTVNVVSGFYKMIESTVENYGAAAIRTLRGGDKLDRIIALKSGAATFTSWRSAWQAAAKAWSEGLPQTDILARSEMSMRGGVPTSIAGKVLTAPSRAIMTIDEFFKHIFYRQELTARAVEVAANAARVEGKNADEVFARVLKETLEQPPDDLVLDAIEGARYNTFQANLDSKFANDLVKWTNGTPLLKFVVPFVKTPLNILKQGVLERSPLAALRSKFWKEVTAGGRRGDQAAARALLGTAAVGLFWHWAGEGRVTGSRVGRGARKNTADLSGAPPYSIRIGDTWYQYNRLDPIGTLLGLTSDLRLMARDFSDANTNNLETDDRDLADAFGNVLAIFTENITDKTFFKGIADAVEAIESGASEGGSRMTAYLSSLGTNLVPFSSMQRNIARAHDDYAREAFTFMEKLQAQTPVWREGLPLRRDVLGRPIAETERLGADWVSPFVVGKDDPDPMARALAQLNMPYTMPDKSISGIPLDAEQYSRLLEVRGAYIREKLSEWLSSGEWTDLSRHQQMERVRTWFHRGTRQANTAVLDQWPDLAAMVDGRKGELKALKSGDLREKFIENLLGGDSE